MVCFFLLRSDSILRRIAYISQGFDIDKKSVCNTSSFLDCFCLLADIVDPPASLWTLELPWLSKAGRGIFEAGLLVNAGRLPRPWPRFGVFLMVPVLEAIVYLSFEGRMLSADSMQYWPDREDYSST